MILDLHWSDAGEWGKQIGQHVMPDQNSVTFWKDVAATYKDHPAVIFDLYNEPHDVSWEIWQKGGKVTEKARRSDVGKSYEAVGMQSLLDTVRAAGAKNVVVVGGLNWSYDLSGVLDGRQLSDPDGNGVIYANHAYPFKGDTVERWIGKMEKATKTLPVIVSEFGSDSNGGAGLTGEQWVRHVLQVLEDHELELDGLGHASRRGSAPGFQLEIQADAQLWSLGPEVPSGYASTVHAAPGHKGTARSQEGARIAVNPGTPSGQFFLSIRNGNVHRSHVGDRNRKFTPGGIMMRRQRSGGITLIESLVVADHGQRAGRAASAGGSRRAGRGARRHLRE